MNLVFDCRENKLISLFTEKSIPHVVESLPLGDICIRSNDGDIMILFERKTIADLLSSITDGRYEEQSFRLSESGIDRSKIYYIIEGNIYNFVGKGSGLYSKSTIHSCLYSLSYLKGFSVLCSNSLHHTFEIVEKFYNKLLVEKNTVPTNKGYIDSLKLTKKGNLTDEMVSVMMLAQIPKVSKNAADEIMKHFNYNIKKLVIALNENENCLDDISISVANNKKRKLSKPCISNVKKYLHSIGENEK